MSIQRRTIPSLKEIREKRQEVLRIAARYGASNVRVFGSVARGDAIETSDVDLLVDMAREPDGWEYFGRLEDLRRGIAALLGYDVDIVDYAALDRMKERVLRDAVPL
jgi:uncharacterized protein